MSRIAALNTRRLLLLLLLMTPLASATELLSGQRTIFLQDKGGTAVAIGIIEFTPQPDGQISYQLQMAHRGFRDYFLSMKEMKCLEGPELWCHMAYPYAQPHRISVSDLRWLEHDLLFMYKKPDSFGANFWNGIYYRLELDNGRLTGTAQAVDLNLLASPPDDLNNPPIAEHDIDTAELAQRWLPYIEIR